MKRELVTGLLTLSLLASMLPANAQAAEGMFGASAAGQVQTCLLYTSPSPRD